MATVERRVASVLLVLGVLIVLAGFSAALEFTAWGMLASVAAVMALLYAGAVWFGSAGSRQPLGPPHPLLVFDRDRRIVTGEAAGQPLTSQFPEILRPEIERRCTAALTGVSARFPCLHNGKLILFDALPVRSPDGAIVYGILLSTDAEPAAIAASV